MTKTAQCELYRLFLIERLPEPLTPASSHLQIFDNYITNTRLRLRKVRDPYNRSWTYTLQQHIYPAVGETGPPKLSEIHLSESEYELFHPFEGREIRKNRYFHEVDGSTFTFDVYLGALFGLNMARVDLDSMKAVEDLVPPPFAIFDVTGDRFFAGDSLVDRTFGDVQARVAQIGATVPPAPESVDE
jgi:CYTH domain-containing protein